jgi:hypothetical protein
MLCGGATKPPNSFVHPACVYPSNRSAHTRSPPPASRFQGFATHTTEGASSQSAPRPESPPAGKFHHGHKNVFFAVGGVRGSAVEVWRASLERLALCLSLHAQLPGAAAFTPTERLDGALSCAWCCLTCWTAVGAARGSFCGLVWRGWVNRALFSSFERERVTPTRPPPLPDHYLGVRTV